MTDQDLSGLKIDKTQDSSRPRRKRKWVMVAGVLLLIAGIGLLYGKGLLRRAPAVKVMTAFRVYPSQSLSVLNASGYVVAQRKAAVASKVTGRLVALLVEEGDHVTRDQIVARLEDLDVLAARDQAAAGLTVARANLEQARAELANATLTYERNRRLLKTGSVAEAQFDGAEARYRTARAAVGSAEASIQSAQAALRAAGVAVEYTLIRAPFDSVVLTKDADVGDIVTPLGAASNAKAAVVSIADMDSLQVEVDVSETNLILVKAGEPCEIQLDALPDDRFRGAVQAIVPTADRTKASVEVKIRFLDQDPRILPEMSAKVAFLSRELEPSERTSCLGLPRAALVPEGAGDAVFLVVADRVRKAPVRSGREFGDTVEILEGVQAGEKVVLSPPAGLAGNARIRIAED